MAVFRRLGLLTTIVTFLLIVAYGSARVSESGLGCFDWPTCQNQIAPPFVLQTIIAYANQFVISIVNLLVVVVALSAWSRFRRYRWVTWSASLAILALIIQDALGHITVGLQFVPIVSTARLGAMLAVLAAVTATVAFARWATDTNRGFHVDSYAGFTLVTVLLTYVLMLIGVYVAESTAAYACDALPFCGTGLGLPSDGPSSLNVLHRLVAGLVLLLFLYIVFRANAARPGESALHGQLSGGVALLIAQIVVGAAAVIWRIPPLTAALHLALAAAFWGDVIALAVLACFPRHADSIDESPEAVRPESHLQTMNAVKAYVNLTKPRIIVLLLITTLGGMIIAARAIPSPVLIVCTLIGGAFAAGGANAINCYIDRDIDQLMHRTQNRSLPKGSIPPFHALVYGLILGTLSFIILATFVNLLSAVLALAGLLFYVLVYTGVLKRSTPQNIVIGGAAGAFPPMVGWVAVTGRIDLLAVYLFAIVFFWTPPHFWALSLLTSQDYARANIPMLPLVAGEGETRRQIFLYTILLVALTLLLVGGQTMGVVYFALAFALGAGFIYYAGRLLREGTRQRASQLFHYSNLYLALMFLAMAVDRLAPPILGAS